MSGVVSCILPEDFPTMALSNLALQDLYFLFHHIVLAILLFFIVLQHLHGNFSCKFICICKIFFPIH